MNGIKWRRATLVTADLVAFDSEGNQLGWVMDHVLTGFEWSVAGRLGVPGIYKQCAYTRELAMAAVEQAIGEMMAKQVEMALLAEDPDKGYTEAMRAMAASSRRALTKLALEACGKKL